jgi:pyrroloquinoline quinone biosynthesis protein D
MTETPVYALADGVSFETVSDGSVVLVFRSGQLYSCNDTSTAFLTELDGKRGLDQVAVAMAERFDAAPEDILADLHTIAGEMLAEGIIVSGK